MAYPITNATDHLDRHPSFHNAYIDVKAHYDAVGNGSANDTAPFVSALTTGRNVYVPPGTYALNTATITSQDNIRLSGGRASVLKGPGGADPAFLSFQGCDDIIVEGLTFDMNDVTTFGGLKFYGCNRVTVRDCRFLNSTTPPAWASTDRFAIIVVNDGTYGTCSDVHILNNDISDLAIECDNVVGLEVAGNIMRNPGRTTAIGSFSTTLPVGTSDVVIHDNIIIDPVVSSGAIAIVVDPANSTNMTYERIRIHDNMVIQTGATTYRGLLIGTPSSVTASSGNVFSDIDVHDNTFAVTGAGTMSDNHVYVNNSATAALDIDRVSFRNNRILGNNTGSEYAMRIKSADNFEVIGNVITGVVNGLAVSESVTGEVVVGNVVSASGTAIEGSTTYVGFNDAGGITVKGAFDHDGTTFGIFGVAPATRPSAYTVSNVDTDRTYNASSTDANELADVLGTLIADLKTLGILQ